MKIINTFIKLKGKEKHDCGLCSGLFKRIDATYLLRTSDLDINKTIDINYVCDNCKERVENSQVDKCADCGRLKKKPTIKCLCVYMKENNLTAEDSSDSSDEEYNPIELEKQISTLSEEKNQLAEEVDTHLEALEISEVWNKRQKQELLDRIKELEAENKNLKKQTSQELLKENEELKVQLEQKEQQIAQIEIKSSKKPFLFFGKKS